MGALRSLKDALRRTPLYGALWQARWRRSLRAWTAHDQRMLDLYASFLRAGDLCFDVGAHIGGRTKVFRRLGATVVAVEPQPACVAVLRAAFEGDPGVRVVPVALGAAPGRAEMMLSDAPTLSSLSRDWVEAVRRSGRFVGHRWDRKIDVPMTSLDALIARHGQPEFIKIDVEGYEFEVLRGLSRPVPFLSFEFTPEYGDTAERCIGRLSEIGDVRLNYSAGESMVLEADPWMPAPDMIRRLRRLYQDARVFGDVYVSFPAAASRRSPPPAGQAPRVR